MVLHIPAGGIFISASLLGQIWGRGHVEVQVELSWAGNSGLNLNLNQTPFHVPSLIYCKYIAGIISFIPGQLSQEFTESMQ